MCKPDASWRPTIIHFVPSREFCSQDDNRIAHLIIANGISYVSDQPASLIANGILYVSEKAEDPITGVDLVKKRSDVQKRPGDLV